jgi:hypothetical protein
MKTGFFIGIMALITLNIQAQQPDANTIMEKCRENALAGSMRADVMLTIKEKNGSVRERTISMATKTYPGDVEKRFIKFLAPADIRGTAMLIIDNKTGADEMWIYLPALKKIRRIVSSEKGKSFMNSEFSNADMSSPPASDFVSTHIDGSGQGDQWIIESRPGSEDIADEYGYSRKVSYINSQNYQVTKMEFYNFDNQLFKIIQIKSVFPLNDGKYFIDDMMVNNLTTGRSSEMALKNIETGTRIDDNIFTQQSLGR